MDKNLRNEKKFIFYSPSQSIEKFIESLGAEYLYPQRKINSIYFDSIYFKDFYHASEGIYSRSKTRVRWYNETFNTEINPTLEIKISNKNLIKRIDTTILEMKFKDKNYLDANFFAKLLNKKIDKFSKYQIGMINSNFNLSNLIY